jgi:hypothetical protein
VPLSCRQSQPQCNGALDPGAEVLTAAPSDQKRLIDPLDEDTAILHRFDAVRCLCDFASGGIVVGERVTISAFASSPLALYPANELHGAGDKAATTRH